MIFSGGRWERSGHGFHDVVGVVVDLERRLLYLLDLHVQLRCQLLQLAPRVRRHQRRLRLSLWSLILQGGH